MLTNFAGVVSRVAVYAGASAALASSWIAYYPYPLRLQQGGQEERCLSRLPM